MIMQTPQWLHVFIDIRADVAEASAKFWSAALGWQLGDPWPKHPEFRSFEPGNGEAYVHQQVGDHGPRIHFDLEVTDEVEVERLAQLGARLVGEPREWWPMISPGGLPFCLVRRRDHVRPSPLSWDGHRSRLVQVCVDSPAAVHEAEVAFWRSALGWRWATSDSEEFEGKLHPPSGSSVQLLFQRLGEDDSATAVRAHIDLGADDVAADAERLAQLGAQRVGPGHGWIVLRDPTGLVFCTTGNSPDAP
jgi:predicted enzyme related to lactoylglutathione lyase